MNPNMNIALADDFAGSAYDRQTRGRMETKWKNFTEGLQSRSAFPQYGAAKAAELKALLAFLTESEVGHLMRVHGINALSEDVNATMSTGMASYYRTILPVLRRLVVNLITPNLVTTVPLGGPIGAIFKREARYASNKGSTARNTKAFENLDVNYMTEKVYQEHVATGDGSKYGASGSPLNTNLGFYPARPLDSTNGYIVTIEHLNGSTVVQTAVDDGAGGFTGDTTAGAINYETGAITGFLFTAAPTSGHTIKVTYWYDSEGSSLIPEMNLDVELVPVVSRTNKIKASASAEAGDNYGALYGLDVEQDIASILTAEMALETDRNTVQDLLSYATSDGVTTTYDRAVTASDDNEMSAVLRIMTPITDVSQRIAETGKRGPANWIVTSPAIAGIFMQLAKHADFIPSATLMNTPGLSPMNAVRVPQSHDSASVDFGVLEFGLLGSAWRVYQDPYLSRTKLLMGRKGDNVLDSDYIWSPFIMAQLTQTFVDPGNMTMRKGIRSRDARTRLRPNFGVITASNLTLA